MPGREDSSAPEKVIKKSKQLLTRDPETPSIEPKTHLETPTNHLHDYVLAEQKNRNEIADNENEVNVKK
ncbi:hypothetical protein [Flagellimonas marinaquae]